MNFYQSLRQFVIGAPLDPLSTRTRHNLALVAFFAWVGLGADGISSSCYGPEEAFKALGEHTHLGLYLAVATIATVFIIALAYNQVIELFPTGGGGYRVASRLLGPYAGVVSGAALLVDYVLTIAISVAAGVDALFSLLPVGAQKWKLASGLVIVTGLLLLNLRGMKEAIRVLLPIFLGFVVTHVVLIHSLSVLLGVVQGFDVRQLLTLFLFYPQDYGVPLPGVYAVWLLVIALLYPLCRWVADFKTRRRDWWLSYL